MPPTQDSDTSEALEGVSRVVLRALSQLTPAADDGSALRPPMESYLGRMVDAVLSADPDCIWEVVRDMRKARITIPQIAESYVPVVARRLGEGWEADCVNFAAVTIGSSRLQALLRRLEVDWDQSHETVANTPPAFLVGVPDGIQHTLGASVLAGQLRHRGLSVHLDIEITTARLCAQVRSEVFSGVMLSFSGVDQLDRLRNLVNCVRQYGRSTPVVIGGALLERVSDIQEHTGADFVTNDVHEALRFCDVHFAARDTAVGAPQRGAQNAYSDAGLRSAAE